jgi:hypothetical protein
MRRCDGGPPIAIPFPGRVGWKKAEENDNYGAPIKNVDIIWSLFEVSIGTPNSAIIIVNKFITKHSIFSIIPSNRVYGNPNRRLLSALGDDRDNVTMVARWPCYRPDSPPVFSVAEVGRIEEGVPRCHVPVSLSYPNNCKTGAIRPTGPIKPHEMVHHPSRVVISNLRFDFMRPVGA